MTPADSQVAGATHGATPGDRYAARAALEQGRGTYIRLDQIRSPEDTAADIIDLWHAAESAMRAMLGGSVLSGQALVRELRQRGVIGLEQANTLAAFWDARTRVDSVNYKPTLTDVGYARVGYDTLGRAIDDTHPRTEAAPPVTPQPNAAATPSSIEMPVYERPVRPAWRFTTRFTTPLWIGIAAGALLLIGIVAYLVARGSSYDRDMASGVDLMRSGRTESARAAFANAARERPNEAEPHVFLARLSRNEGDASTARRELATAIRNEPENALAQREMGLLLLSLNDAELARRFLVRAVQLAPTDPAAQGYLGCALLRLNRADEGRRFLNRAGPGTWSACTMPTIPGAPTSVPSSATGNAPFSPAPYPQ